MWSPVKITGAFHISLKLYQFTPNCRARMQSKERGMLACWVSVAPSCRFASFTTDIAIHKVVRMYRKQWYVFHNWNAGVFGCSLLTLEFPEDVLFSFGCFFFDARFLIQQNYLRVAFQEVNSGCTGKTLLVRPYITTEDVCQLCAEKFKVDNPKEYSLFLFIDDTWQQLAEDTYPQKIKAELHSRPQPQVFHFVYKRINSDPYSAIFQNDDSAS